MLFPKTVTFDKVFCNAQPSVFKNAEVQPAPFGPWVKDEATEMMIGTYCRVRGGNSIQVEPFASVLDFVRANMINIELDQVHFEIIPFNGRVYAKYGAILGSRLVCTIDPDTIPFQ